MSDQDIKTIAQSVLGAELNELECQALSEITSQRSLKKDEILFREGASDDQLYVLVTGKIDVIKNYGQKDETVMATLKPGALAGELSFIDGEPHSMTLKSRAESEVIILHRADFEKLIDTHPTAVYHVMRAILRASHKLQRELNTRFMEMNRFVTNQYM
ncbi:cyclic nucleotide-binding domain-containing protein [Thiomicrospira microaerophila]|uniref:Crp/Fnr family transcriptional regulator n=1 Tax=Thiomicrospira microaerophila TaxID=406020 RepID=UPI00200BA8C5|nr:cyclic nucleotide-binding domain-containing protein [Thiomicrospira microaerophila]UQB41390.1 cyclic nucleotide-binding domain-containing protein [Thiomicrospira microaerophila]